MPKPPLLSVAAIAALTACCCVVFGQTVVQTAPQERTPLLNPLKNPFDAQQRDNASAGRIRVSFAVSAHETDGPDAHVGAAPLQPHHQMRALENRSRTDMILYRGHFGQNDFVQKPQFNGMAYTIRMGR